MAGFVACRLACNGLAWLQAFLALRLFAGSHVLKGVSTVISQSALPTRGAGVSKLNSSCFWLVVMHAALVCLVITVAQLFKVVRQAWAAVSVALHLVVAWPAVTRSTTQERCL